jgi:hypothetical protein
MFLNIVQSLKKEAKSLAPAIIYFLVCFSILHYAQMLLVPDHALHTTTYLSVVIGAILAGKVILITEHIALMNSFADKPLVYNIVWKFIIYTFFVLVLQLLEHTLHKFYATDNWIQSYDYVLDDIRHPVFWGVQILVLLVFLIFTIFHEMMRVIGRKKMIRIFFGF